MDQRLTEFIAACDKLAGGGQDAGANVAAIAPLMLELVRAGRSLLDPDHLREDPEQYARNAIHVGEADGVSLFALVWLPGQWTPIHDHGTWGVVGVLDGVLEERAFLPATGWDDADYYPLTPGGIVFLSPGSVSTFVPNPDHIHVTGVPEDREPVVSLHLYGRLMNSFHLYTPEHASRRLIDVPHYESS
jgi:predicted metal-dependent enzyme (double-stranded beta helix superfamily)